MADSSARKTSWVQPSLSRDFALLSAAIIFVMLLISAWVAWITYIKHSERIVWELEKETDRIERTLQSEIQATGHLLEAIGRQLAAHNPNDLAGVARLLQAFSTGNPQYALWSWSDPSQRILVSSSKGVLDEPVDIRDRDYIHRSTEEPWRIYVGAPVEGRVSSRWVIPEAIGITDPTGRYIGTLTASIDIGSLTDQISHLVKREGISFAVVSKSFVPLTVVADNEESVVRQLPIDKLKTLDTDKQSKGVISQAGLVGGSSIYSYYLVSGQYPYIIVVGYDSKASDSAIRSLLWPRMIQIGVVAGFLLAFLWIIRARVIKPVIELSGVAASVATGNGFRPLRMHGPQEIEQLAQQLGLISDYIAERRLIEDELRNKIAHLHRRLQRGQMEVRQRSVLLAGLLAEYKKSLRSINSQAQVLKDQLYGPIEDKKYRQYAADIHQTGTTLELMVRKLIALSRVDAAAIVTRDETVRLSALLDGARRFVAEMLENGVGLTLKMPEGVPPEVTLQLDSLHVQQAIGYIILYLVMQQPPGQQLTVQLLTVPAAKGEEGIALILGKGPTTMLSADHVSEALDDAQAASLQLPVDDGILDQMHITLAQAMLELQQIGLAVIRGREAGVWVAVGFPPRRIMSVEKA